MDNDDWDESTLTWETAPEAVLFIDSRSDIRATDEINFWNTTDAFQTESSLDNLLTFELNDGYRLNRKAEFHSRESGSGPILRVITETLTRVGNNTTLPK